MLLTIYLLSVIYCIVKMYRANKERHEDPLYATPAMDTLAILVMAPVLMAVDATATWVRKYKEYKEYSKQDKIF